MDASKWASEIIGSFHWNAVRHDVRHPSTLEIPEPDKCSGCRELKRRRLEYRRGLLAPVVSAAQAHEAQDRTFVAEWDGTTLRMEGATESVIGVLSSVGCELSSQAPAAGDGGPPVYAVNLRGSAIGVVRFWTEHTSATIAV